jgi:hypothetical protein
MDFLSTPYTAIMLSTLCYDLLYCAPPQPQTPTFPSSVWILVVTTGCDGAAAAFTAATFTAAAFTAATFTAATVLQGDHHRGSGRGDDALWAAAPGPRLHHHS